MCELLRNVSSLGRTNKITTRPRIRDDFESDLRSWPWAIGLVARQTSDCDHRTALLLAAGQMFFVVPSYRRLLQSLGVVPSLPSRLAIATSTFGLLLFAVVVLGIGISYWQARRDRARLFAGTLSVAALLSVLYLALAACVYWDVARVMERIH